MERIGEQQQQQRLKANQLTGCFGRAPAPVHSRSKHHMLSNAASQQALPSLVRHLCLTSHHLFTPPPHTHVSHPGGGEFGEVYKAKWHGSYVAAKVLKRSDEIALGDFRTEIAILRKIHHPNCVQVLDREGQGQGGRRVCWSRRWFGVLRTQGVGSVAACRHISPCCAMLVPAECLLRLRPPPALRPCLCPLLVPGCVHQAEAVHCHH